MIVTDVDKNLDFNGFIQKLDITGALQGDMKLNLV